MSKKTLLLVPLAAMLALLGAGLWFALESDSPPHEDGAVARPDDQDAPRAEAPPATEPAATLRAVETSAQPSLQRGVETTVAWPVEVELELVRAAGLPEARGVAPLGSGRTARLAGRIQGEGERGVPAVLRIEAGFNLGRVLQANAEGSFGATDLYPGLALVRIEGPGIPGSLREVRLASGQETLLNIGYGLPGSVAGTVYDESGGTLKGVEVELDGRRTTSDEQGNFSFASMTSGTDLALLLRKEGYATYYKRLGVSAGRDIPLGIYKFLLEQAAGLEISIPRRVGDAGPAMVVLSPAETTSELKFAWQTVSPLEVIPGASTLVEGLPPGRVSVRVYHRGAVAEPQQGIAILRAGQVERMSIELVPAPLIVGRVTGPDELPIEDAEVVLEAPDRVAAGAMHLSAFPAVFETCFFPPLPPAVQRTKSGSDGGFTLTAWAESAPSRYLTATSPDGKLWAGRVVAAGSERVDLRLAPPEHGNATLRLDFPGRFQGLPVRVTVGGEVRPEVVLDVGELLALEGLTPGTWRLSARWNGRTLFSEPEFQEFELSSEVRREVPLPPDAVQGQDEDTLLRAGARRR